MRDVRRRWWVRLLLALLVVWLLLWPVSTLILGTSVDCGAPVLVGRLHGVTHAVCAPLAGRRIGIAVLVGEAWTAVEAVTLVLRLVRRLRRRRQTATTAG